MAPSPDIIERAKKIRLIGMDVDGVLTAGEIIVLDSQEEVKIWNVKDRMGFHLLRLSGAGIKLAWITGRKSRQVEDRARECGVDAVHQDCMSKKKVMDELLGRFGLSPDQVLFVGDDLIDVPVMKYVGLAVCPSDACDEARAAAHYVSPVAGGRGIAREIIEIVLKAQGAWDKAVERYR